MGFTRFIPLRHGNLLALIQILKGVCLRVAFGWNGTNTANPNGARDRDHGKKRDLPLKRKSKPRSAGSDKSRSGEFFGFYDIFGKFSAIMGPSLVGFTSALAADIALKNQGLTAETADPAVVEAVTAQAAPWGILSLMLIFFIGGGLYFFVLPRYLKKEGN